MQAPTPSESFLGSPLLPQIVDQLPADVPGYLVGGAVRDMLLRRPLRDLDIVMAHDPIPIARRVADHLGADFYVLDAGRGYGRIVFSGPENGPIIADFTPFQGPDLESDLHARDFTVNAIAVDLRRPDHLIDPLGGAPDLHERLLRACSRQAMQDDPLRVLRGVRLAAAFELRITPETLTFMREAAPQLSRVSSERIRDEILRILSGRKASAALSALDQLGVLALILPELIDMKGVTQSAPHIHDVWGHTLDTISQLNTLLDVLGLVFHPDSAANLQMGLVSLRLGRFREALHVHLGDSLNPDRPPRSLLFLAALYHDIGKPTTREVDQVGRIRFFEHDRIGAEIAAQRAHWLHLSNPQIERLKKIVRYHLRPMLLAQSSDGPSRRAIYRFFRDAGPAGVDVCLLSLADTLGTYGPTLPQEVWGRHLEVVRALLQAWWDKPEESVSPPKLLSGDDLITELGIGPGPLVGKLLEEIREAQATGRVTDRKQALALARKIRNDC